MIILIKLFELAIKYNQVAMLRFLIARGVDPNCSLDGNPALGLAVSRGHVDIVRALLEAGADPDCIFLGIRVLALAVSRGHVAIVRVLLEVGAEININVLETGAGSIYGMTILELAAHRVRNSDRHAEIFGILLEAGADVDGVDLWNRTSLMLAAGDGDIGVVESLLQANARLDIVSSVPGFDGFSALGFALDQGNFNIAYRLMQAENSIKTLLLSRNKREFLNWAKDHIDCAKFILKYGHELSDLSDEDRELPIFKEALEKYGTEISVILRPKFRKSKIDFSLESKIMDYIGYSLKEMRIILPIVNAIEKESAESEIKRLAEIESSGDKIKYRLK